MVQIFIRMHRNNTLLSAGCELPARCLLWVFDVWKGAEDKLFLTNLNLFVQIQVPYKTLAIKIQNSKWFRAKTIFYMNAIHKNSEMYQASSKL